MTNIFKLFTFDVTVIFIEGDKNVREQSILKSCKVRKKDGSLSDENGILFPENFHMAKLQ